MHRPSRPTDAGWPTIPTSRVHVRCTSGHFPIKAKKNKLQVTVGLFPAWSRDTRELFFRTADRRIVVAAYMAQGDSFAPKKKVWSKGRPADPGGNRNFDLAPDGKRILALMDVDSLDELDPASVIA